MKKTTVLVLPLILIMIIGLACKGSASKQPTEPATNTPQPTVNTQDTVDSAVAATSTMQSSYQGAVSTSVAATVTAMPPVPTPMSTETYVTLTEEELEALINTSVQDAATATTQASTAASQAAADGVITEDELVMLYSYWIYADDLIVYADELIEAYNDVYNELAVETLGLLQMVEGDLSAIAQQTETALQSLEEFSLAVEQGSAQTSQILSQLETEAETAQAKAVDAQGQAQAWSARLKTVTQLRVEQALAVQPQQRADSRKAAIQSAFAYIDSVRTAFADHKISQAELANIAQLGADAAASLDAQGGAQLAKLAGSVNAITAQIAAGQMQMAQANLANFQAALPALP